MKNQKNRISQLLFFIIILSFLIIVTGCTFFDPGKPSGNSDREDDTGPPDPPKIEGVEDGGVYMSCKPEFTPSGGEIYTATIEKDGEVPVSYTSGTPLCQEGYYVLSVTAQKNGYSVSTTVSFAIDGTPPGAPVIDGESPTNDFTPTWEWTAPDDAVLFRCKLDEDNWVETEDTEFTPSEVLTKGCYVLCVQAKDKAGNWSESSSKEIVVNPFIYVATNNGFNYSYDDGYTFHTIDLPNNSCKSVFGENESIYIATGDGIAILENGKEPSIIKEDDPQERNRCNDVYVRDGSIYIATEGGVGIRKKGQTYFKFKTQENGLGCDKCNGVFVDENGIYVATLAGISISRNGGNTFENKKSGLDDPPVCFGVYAGGGKIYAATWGGGIGISVDGGENFTAVKKGLGSINCYGVCAQGDKVFAATTGGVSRSTDGGETFLPVAGEGLEEDCIRDIFYVYNTLYVATWGKGIGISDDDGATFRMAKSPESQLSDNICLGIWVE
jgi:hypothetical protein